MSAHMAKDELPEAPSRRKLTLGTRPVQLEVLLLGLLLRLHMIGVISLVAINAILLTVFFSFLFGIVFVICVTRR